MGCAPRRCRLGGSVTEKDLVVHDETNLSLAFMLGNFEPPLPTPVGVFYAIVAPDLRRRGQQAARGSRAKQGVGDLKALLHRGDVWTVS